MRRRLRLIGLTALLVACSRGAQSPAPRTLRAFTSGDSPISSSGVSPDAGGWRLDRSAAGSVPLFEVSAPDLEQVTLTYRATMKAQDLDGRAYLEMWVRVPGRGEFFSRGLDRPLTGSSDWSSYAIPFFLNEEGAVADLVRLNVAFEGSGTVWIRDVELLEVPLR